MSELVYVHPAGGVDYPRTFQELLEWFPDNAACLAYLERLRWPEGFICPACGQPGGWRTAKARWMCRACGRQSSTARRRWHPGDVYSATTNLTPGQAPAKRDRPVPIS